jgi:hypothetical protein
MRLLDELGREIERVAAEAGRAGVRRRSWRPGLLVALTPLVVATVALAAAGGIPFGEPVKNPAGLQLDPKAGLGVIVGPGRLLAARASDPAGGPQWGMRLVRTSRGLGCVQLGRLVDDRLGVLGRDSSFNDDGKFHELGARVLRQPDCQQTDARGRLFIAMTAVGVPESADVSACAARAHQSDRRPLCPPASLRTVYYGLLGPQAKAITYGAPDGAIVRQRVRTPDGAYLVVLPADPHRANTGYFMPGVTPSTGLRSVEYRDGTTCVIRSARRLGGARACPLKGFTEPDLPAVSRADLVTPIHVRVGKHPEHPGPKVKLPAGAPAIPAQRRLTISFRARREADARSFYTFSARVRHGRQPCPYAMAGPIAKDIAAGAVVTEKVYFPYSCRGTVVLSVGYTQQRRPGQMPFDIGGFGNGKVGRVLVTLP